MTNAYYAFADLGEVANNAIIGHIDDIKAGTYVIFAKLYVAQGSSSPNKVSKSQITAELHAEGDFDVAVTTVPLADDNPFRSGAASLALNVAHTFSHDGGSVFVKVDKKPDTTLFLEWAFLKITVISVDSLQRIPIPPK